MIRIGLSTKNQQQIALGGAQMQRVYVGDKLVWQKQAAYATIKFGLLYNPYVIFDSRILIAPGWHFLNRSDLDALRTYSGNASTVAIKCKDTEAGWAAGEATNEYKLNLRKSSFRHPDGTFASHDCYLFVKWYNDSWRFGYMAAGGGTNALPSDWIAFNTTHGFSVRAVKDSTTLTHGQSGLYVRNDGIIQRTICIGTKEWLADNLAETKFRNGDIIPEITSNAAWQAQTSPALCTLNNNSSNL